jgi:hypothetical protein
VDLGRLRREAFLATPAEQVLVRIDEAGADQAFAGVDEFDIDPERFDGVAIDLADQADLAVDEQDRLLTEMLRCVDVAVLDESEHAPRKRKRPARARVRAFALER